MTFHQLYNSETIDDSHAVSDAINDGNYSSHTTDYWDDDVALENILESIDRHHHHRFDWKDALFVAAFFVTLVYVLYKLSKIEEDSFRQQAWRETDSGVGNNLATMTQEERTKVYNKAFDRNQNQLVLEPSHIIVAADGNTTTDDKDETMTPDLADDPSVHLALMDARSHLSSSSSRGRKSSIAPAPNGKRRSSMLHPRASRVDLETGAAASPPATSTIRAHCVICFEDLAAGDTVVWSETPSCPHVYHKDCLVAFLAHRAQNAKVPDENPCPACRQHFVTVVPPQAEAICPIASSGGETATNSDRTARRMPWANRRVSRVYTTTVVDAFHNRNS